MLCSASPLLDALIRFVIRSWSGLWKYTPKYLNYNQLSKDKTGKCQLKWLRACMCACTRRFPVGQYGYIMCVMSTMPVFHTGQCWSTLHLVVFIAWYHHIHATFSIYSCTCLYCSACRVVCYHCCIKMLLNFKIIYLVTQLCNSNAVDDWLIESRPV